jgi:hypothetical protein
MILEKVKRDIIQTGDEDTIKMTINQEVMSHAVKILTEYSYEKPLESLIREQISNSLDSIQEASTKNPAILRLFKNDSNQWELNFIDDGLGLDREEFEKYIMGIGNSTKRNNPLLKGGFGGGSKVALSYTDNYNYTCRKNGIERKFLVFKGEEFPESTMIYEEKTNERNGVIISVILNNYDYNSCINAIKEQCGYLNNVYFDVPDFDNEYSIFKSDNYQINTLHDYSEMHISLLDVYYPINWNKLGINRIYIPIALKFDDYSILRPNYTRETIEWNNKSIQAVKDKIKLIAEEFITKYNNSIEETENIQEIFKYYNTNSNSKYINIGGSSFDVTILSEYSTININTPKLKNVSLLNLKTLYSNRNYIFGEYRLNYTMYNYKFQHNKNSSFRDIQPMSINKKNYYIYDETIPGNKKTYFRETLDSSAYYFVRKFTNFRLFKLDKYYGYNNYYDILDLKQYPKEQWRQVIKEFQYVQSLLLENFINVDDFVIPQEWHNARKKKRVSISSGGTRKTKLEGEITCKLAVPLLRYNNGNNCKFMSETYKLKDIYKQKCLLVYTEHDKFSKLDKLFEIASKQKINFITLADPTLKIVEKLNIHNLISYKEFMEGKNAPFKRIVTSYVIKQLVDENDSLFRDLSVIELISENLYKKLDDLYEYQRDNYVYSSDSAITAMLEVATNNNLFDKNIYPEYLEMKALLEKLPFMNIIVSKMFQYNKEKDEMFPILVDMFKYYKQRINYKHYNITLNEENTEILTNEIIEELI